jgi:serine O-acetyltransferase
MRRAVLRTSRRLSDALPSAAGGVGVSPAVRDQTQFEQLRAEAFARRARPDMAALVKCGSLHEAVAEVVSAKMSRSASDTRLPRGALRQLLWDALRGDERVGADVAAIIKRDPASTTHLQTVAYLKGFHAVQAQRAAHRFWRAGGFENDHVAFAIQDRVNELWSLCIHPGAQIGGGCFIDHATSVVIGETATIGRDCTILHGVTLGGTGKARTKRHPSIGDRVTLGVGATARRQRLIMFRLARVERPS